MKNKYIGKSQQKLSGGFFQAIFFKIMIENLRDPLKIL